MKRVLVILVAAGLVLAAHTASVNAQSSSSNPPPVEQPLVSEGEFAVEMATALKLNSPHDEAAAESSLAGINIAPRNGWISNYPMTPDIIAEVRESTTRSASAGSLNISEADAAGIVDSVSTALNLPIKAAGEKYSYESSYDSTAASSSEYQSSSAAAPPEVSEYEEPPVVEVPEEEYYDGYGPPIVTYYPPPWAYAYLYDWVPWPFCWGGLGFGGFFILSDFDRNDHHHRFTNHVTNANGTVSRVNAVTRSTGTGTQSASTLAGAGRSAQTIASAGRSTQGTRLSSANAQADARTIINRQAGSGAENTAGASTTPRTPASSGSLRNMGNTTENMRNAVTATQTMNRLASANRAQTMSQDAVRAAPSFSGRTFNTASPARSFSGRGLRSIGGRGMRGIRGGGFHGGGFHGGGGGGHR